MGEAGSEGWDDVGWRFPQEMGICTYCESSEQGRLVPWVEWHRRAGVGRFYIYTSARPEAIQEELAPYVQTGLVLVIGISKDSEDEDLRWAACNDCLNRCRFETEWLAFLEIDEYLQEADARQGLPGTIRKVFAAASAVAVLEVSAPKGVSGRRYLVNPRLCRLFLQDGRIVPCSGWQVVSPSAKSLKLLNGRKIKERPSIAPRESYVYARSELDKKLAELERQAPQLGSLLTLEAVTLWHLYLLAPAESRTLGTEVVSAGIVALLHDHIWHSSNKQAWEYEILSREARHWPETMPGWDVLRMDVQLFGRSVRIWRRQAEAGIAALATAEEKKYEPRRIALLSHVMARNGAPMALLLAAKVLREAGFAVDAFSIVKGPMIAEFEALGIPVTVEPALQAPLADQPWYQDYDLIIANTAVMAGCFRKPLTSTPVIWWLHESPSSLKWIRLSREIMQGLFPDNVTTLGVSEAANRAIHALAPDWPIAGCIPLGVEDVCRNTQPRQRKSDGKLVFLQVGSIERNKGQDVFLRALERLSTEERNNCDILMIGESGNSTDADYQDTLTELLSRCPEVRQMGFLSHEKLLAMYEDVDVLVVPSWEESFSLVALEAMMMGVLCLISDSAGVASYLKDGKDGLIFPCGDSAALADKMRWLLSNEGECKRIGVMARELYEDKFSMAIFRKNVCALVEQLLLIKSEK